MSDIRSYSTIAEHADPSQLAGQLNIHRAAMNDAILGENGTVMQFVGDAVMAVFGAPFAQDDHADRAVAAALAHAREATRHQCAVGERKACPPFGLGLGLSTGEAAARSARVRGAAGVHLGRGHGEHVAEAPAVGGGGGDRPVGGDADGTAGAGDDGRPPAAVGEGTRHAGGRVQVGR